MRSLIICSTCRFSAEDKLSPEGVSGGETLARHIKAELTQQNRNDVSIKLQACLWNCKNHCSVIIQDNSKYSYVTGNHAPNQAQAQAILAWYDLHSTSPTGEVSFRSWPEAMRGHFIARIPPAEGQDP